MAWKYKASYGYVMNVNGLTGLDPTQDLTISDDYSINGREMWFCIVDGGPDIPTRKQTDIDLGEARSRLYNTLKDKNSVTLIPGKFYNTIYHSHINDGGEITYITDLFPNAFYNCPNLVSMMDNMVYEQTPITSFVYLKSCERWIDFNGNVYKKNSNTGLLERVNPGSNPNSINMGFGAYSGPLDNSSTTVNITFFGDDTSGNDYQAAIFVSSYKWPEPRGYRGAYRVYTSLDTYSHSNFLSSLKNMLDYTNHKPDIETDPDEEPDDDPYEDPFDPKPSKPGGGGGTKTKPTPVPTPIPTPGDLPDITSSGLVSLYNPGATELQRLAEILWSRDFFNEIQKVRSDPFDVIIGLHCVPVPVTGSSVTMKIGNYDTSSLTTPLVMQKVSDQYVSFDCGSLTINEVWGSYLDYKTRFEIYLPFIGFREIHAEDVLTKTLSLTYTIDLLSGSCVCFLKSDDMVVFTAGGNCAMHVPVTGSDYSEIIKGLIGAAAGVTAAVATGGIAAPAAASAAMGAAANVLTSKIHIQRSGGLSGAMGFMGIRKPYILAYLPNQCVPKNQNKFKGYPSYITKRIGDMSGYTEIESVHLSGIGATDQEIEEIRSLLDKGVML